MSKRTTCTACGVYVAPRGPHKRTPIRCDDCKVEHRRRYLRARSRAHRLEMGLVEDKVRRYARDEARERGVPVDEILREWRA